MRQSGSLVQSALRHPEVLLSLTMSEWDGLIREARAGGLLGTIEARLSELGTLDQLPDLVRAHLIAARNIALGHERSIRWEVHCVQKAIASVKTEMILLKGAAYI